MVKAAPDADTQEQNLVKRIQNGEPDKFYELVKPYERRVYTAAFAILRNAADAEEVAQEAILKAFANLRQFRAESKFSTWLIQITINESRMKLRKDHRHLYESLNEPQSDEEGDYWPSDFADWREIPSEALETKELRQALLAFQESYNTNWLIERHGFMTPAAFRQVQLQALASVA